MKMLVGSWLMMTTLVIACGSAKPKPESALVEEKGSGVPETCCCKSNPAVSEDGKPNYDMAGRMECSSKQGECVDDVQCNGKQQPE